MKIITITRVVTRNIFMDVVARLQNVFGMNLSSYEKMITKAMNSIKEEISEKKIKVKWFRFETSQLTNGAMMITFYGEEK